MAIRYTYYEAASIEYPSKEGVNRISWEDNNTEDEINWTEITREYFPSDPRQENGIAVKSLLAASDKEIEIIKSILGIK